MSSPKQVRGHETRRFGAPGGAMRRSNASQCRVPARRVLSFLNAAANGRQNDLGQHWVGRKQTTPPHSGAKPQSRNALADVDAEAAISTDNNNCCHDDPPRVSDRTLRIMRDSGQWVKCERRGL
jgi:hypothetical protein